MPDGLDQLKQDLVIDLLRAWIDVYDRSEDLYEKFDPVTKQWVDQHGHRVESLVQVVAFMQPDVRVVCRSLVEDALAGVLAELSHPVGTVHHAAEATAARAKSGGEEMGGIDERVVTLEQRVTEIEDWNTQLADVLRRRTEELREASGRLDLAERRLSKLLDRHEELERYAADQLGQDVDELRQTMLSIRMSIRGAGAALLSAEPGLRS